jgi:hypothetical protein
MFILQKFIWFIFGTKRAAIVVVPADVEAAQTIAPRRVVALLNVGAAENLRHLPRIGLDRAWSKTSHAVPNTNGLNFVVRTGVTPGLARPDHSNHRRLTALR